MDSQLLANHSGNQINLSQLIGLKPLAGLITWPELIGNPQATSGQYSTNLRGRGMEFLEVRAYQPGDDARYLDWRVTAKTGKPHTKIYEEERERSLILLLDVGKSMQFGTYKAFKSVLAIQLAAILGWSASVQNFAIGGAIFNQDKFVQVKPNPKQGLIDYLNCAISPLDQLKGSDNNNNLSYLPSLAKGGNFIITISDFLNVDDDKIKQYAWLKKTNKLLNLKITDPFEQGSLTKGKYSISDGINNFYQLNIRQANDYKKFFVAQQVKFLAMARQLQIPSLILSTKDDLLLKLKEINKLCN